MKRRDTSTTLRPATTVRKPVSRFRSAGQSAAEYLVVLALLSLALTVGPDSPLEQVFRACAERYQQFTYAMSRP